MRQIPSSIRSSILAPVGLLGLQSRIARVFGVTSSFNSSRSAAHRGSDESAGPTGRSRHGRTVAPSPRDRPDACM
jgi:hypothetical protein